MPPYGKSTCPKPRVKNMYYLIRDGVALGYMICYDEVAEERNQELQKMGVNARWENQYA